MHFKEYLDGLAAERSARPLPEFSDLGELNAWQESRRRALFQQWGLDGVRADLGRPPEAVVTGVHETAEYRIEKLWFRPLEQLVVTANLYVPHDIPRPAPAILYLCGHSPRQKLYYQEHARRFTQLGFVTLIVDTVQHGEIRGTHKGTHLEGAFHWISRGYSPAAVETWNAMRAIDLLCAREEVDPSRIGATGHSGGGAVSWWAAAADPRVRAIASSSGTGTEASHLSDHTLDGHCDCYFPSWVDGTTLLETYAMVAPRPALIVAPRLDEIFHPESPAAIAERLSTLYRTVGHEHVLRHLSVDAGHRYTPESRRDIFAWMLTHVAGTPTRADAVADIDGVVADDRELLVLGDGVPRPENANSTLPDWFLPPRTPADIDALRTEIRSTCLGFAPSGAPASDPRVEREYEQEEFAVQDVSFASESPWRLKGILWRTTDSRPGGQMTIDLRSPEDGGRRWWAALSTAHQASGDHAIIDVRGTGDTGWHPAQSWHLRRAAAVMGRSIAAMQLWDSLCGVDAIQQLVQPAEITLRAEGDLSVVALFAAVLDPRITRLAVADLPPTIDAATSPDGRADVVEIPHALRIADIPELLEHVSVTHLGSPG